MFWKYIFPLILCILLAIFARKFLCYREPHTEAQRMPRLLVIVICLLGFAPIINYIIFVSGVFAFILIDEVEWREKPFKNEKLQKWLMNS